MIDFKKLVTGFLILAAIASTSAFMFSGAFGTTSQTPQDQTAQLSANDTQSQPQVSPNAFVEPLPEEQSSTPAGTASAASQTGSTGSDLPPVVLTSNYTQNAVQIMTHELAATNPTGPQNAGDGSQEIAEPDINGVIGKISNGIDSHKVSIPNWGADAETQKVHVIKNATLSDEMKYEAALQDIYDKNLAQINLLTPVDSSTLSGSIDQISPLVDTALSETKTVPVPQQFVDLHKSGLELLSYTKNLLALGANAGNDPLKSYLILQAQEKNYQSVVSNFSAQIQKSFPVSEAAPSKASAIFAELFGIGTAHAQYADLTAFAQRPILDILKQVWQTLKDTLLQVLINTIITQFENATLNWIRNGGNPFAVTNWKGLLIDAAMQEANAQINSLVPNLCSEFGPLIKISLANAFLNGGNYIGGRCTLDQLIGDINGFYNSFQNGGWFAYGVTIMPSSNYYAMQFFSHNMIAQDAAQASQAAQNEGVSSRGFLSMKKCPAGDTLSGSACLPPASAGPIDPLLPPPPPVPAQTVTPGGAVADTVAKALGAKPDTITSATSITGILTTFAASVINTLVSKGASLL